MLENSEKDSLQNNGVEVSVNINGEDLNFIIYDELPIMNKLAIIDSIMNVVIIDEVDYQRIDRNIADRLLKFLIIQNHTNIPLTKIKEEDTIESIFDFLDTLGTKGVEDIINTINNELNISIYDELKTMLENSIQEFYESRRFRNSFLTRIMDSLSNVREEDITKIDEVVNKLKNILNQNKKN